MLGPAFFVYRVSVRLVPVCVSNGSRNRETEEGSVRQGLNVVQYYYSAGYEQTVCVVIGSKREYALFVACFRHSRSPVPLAVDSLIS